MADTAILFRLPLDISVDWMLHKSDGWYINQSLSGRALAGMRATKEQLCRWPLLRLAEGCVSARSAQADRLGIA